VATKQSLRAEGGVKSIALRAERLLRFARNDETRTRLGYYYRAAGMGARTSGIWYPDALFANHNCFAGDSDDQKIE
jgi:hypothetical protein